MPVQDAQSLTDRSEHLGQVNDEQVSPLENRTEEKPSNYNADDVEMKNDEVPTEGPPVEVVVGNSADVFPLTHSPAQVRLVKGLLMDIESCLPEEILLTRDQRKRGAWLTEVKMATSLAELICATWTLSENISPTCLYTWFLRIRHQWLACLKSCQSWSRMGVLLYALDRAILYSHDEDPNAAKDFDQICNICFADLDDELLLLCSQDSCDYACHTYCCDPPLSRVPRDEWYCPSCLEFRDKTCAVCGGASVGNLIICDDCNCLYHMKCVGLRAAPRTKLWSCPSCVEMKQPQPRALRDRSKRRVIVDDELSEGDFTDEEQQYCEHEPDDSDFDNLQSTRRSARSKTPGWFPTRTTRRTRVIFDD